MVPTGFEFSFFSPDAMPSTTRLKRARRRDHLLHLIESSLDSFCEEPECVKVITQSFPCDHISPEMRGRHGMHH